jgi:hypothetical protein
MIERKLNQIREEFEGFVPPCSFSGGCKKSDTVNGFCVQLKSDGTIGKIEENCQNYESCIKGYKYRYNV